MERQNEERASGPVSKGDQVAAFTQARAAAFARRKEGRGRPDIETLMPPEMNRLRGRQIIREYDGNGSQHGMRARDDPENLHNYFYASGRIDVAGTPRTLDGSMKAFWEAEGLDPDGDLVYGQIRRVVRARIENMIQDANWLAREAADYVEPEEEEDVSMDTGGGQPEWPGEPHGLNQSIWNIDGPGQGRHSNARGGFNHPNQRVNYRGRGDRGGHRGGQRGGQYSGQRGGQRGGPYSGPRGGQRGGSRGSSRGVPHGGPRSSYGGVQKNTGRPGPSLDKALTDTRPGRKTRAQLDAELDVFMAGIDT